MRGSSTGGLLLLVVALLALSGFLTGNLDRWLGWLFDPSRPDLSGGAGAGGAPPVTQAPMVGGPNNPANTLAAYRQLVSIGTTQPRQTA